MSLLSTLQIAKNTLFASQAGIQVAANNVAKGAYAFSFADRSTGVRALAALLALAAAGLVPLLLVR